MVSLVSLLVVASTAVPSMPIQIGDISALQLVVPLVQLDLAKESHQPEVYLLIDSPGGSVHEGMKLIEVLRDLQRSGVIVRCRVTGEAASMAAVLFEAGCSIREMEPGTRLLFHEAALPQVDGGKEADIRHLADEVADITRMTATLVAWRLHMSVDEYLNWIKNRDRWVDAQEAIRIGAADVVKG